MEEESIGLDVDVMDDRDSLSYTKVAPPRGKKMNGLGGWTCRGGTLNSRCQQ